jgi:hypothetical protein
MIIQVDESISLEVHFDPADREQGFDDEIRFRIHESGPEDFRLFAAQIGDGLPAGAAAADRAPDAAQASPEPLSGAGLGACTERSVGTPAGVSASVSQELMLRKHV